MYKTYSSGEFADKLGIHRNTVHSWCDKGELDFTRTPAGHKRIPHRELVRLSGHQKQTDKVALYARVSSHGQKENGDLDRQIEKLEAYCHSHGWNIENKYTDVGSGLNEDRRNLQKLIEEAPNSNYGRILVTYQDRLTRFGFSYLEQLFNQIGIEITVIEDETDTSVEQELVDDMIKLVASFSGKLYGMRSGKKQQVVDKVEKEVKETDD